MDYISKYLKYKNKYISFKNNINLQKGGSQQKPGSQKPGSQKPVPVKKPSADDLLLAEIDRLFESSNNSSSIQPNRRIKPFNDSETSFFSHSIVSNSTVPANPTAGGGGEIVRRIHVVSSLPRAYKSSIPSSGESSMSSSGESSMSSSGESSMSSINKPKSKREPIGVSFYIPQSKVGFFFSTKNADIIPEISRAYQVKIMIPKQDISIGRGKSIKVFAHVIIIGTTIESCKAAQNSLENYVPQFSFNIPDNKISTVIGKDGNTIKGLNTKYRVTINTYSSIGESTREGTKVTENITISFFSPEDFNPELIQRIQTEINDLIMQEDNSFRFPLHANPSNIASSFNSKYRPHLTIKTDGIFFDNRNNAFSPALPDHWISIEGELYRPNKETPPLLFIFKVTVPEDHEPGTEAKKYTDLTQVKQKELTILQLMQEFKLYGIVDNQEVKVSDIRDIANETDTDILSTKFAKHISDNFDSDLYGLFQYRDAPYLYNGNAIPEFPWTGESEIDKHVTGCKWVSKLYIDLMPYIDSVNIDTENKWNLYVKTLSKVFARINQPAFKNGVIKHDGLVITPNPVNKCCLIKIKPKDEMTIDLLFNGISEDGSPIFLAKNGVDASSFIDESFKRRRIELKVGTVYRCYPIEGTNLFVPRDERESNKTPNGIDHCHTIKRLYESYFDLSELVGIYKSPPWYTNIDTDYEQKLIKLGYLYEFSQNVYNRYIKSLIDNNNNENSSVLDIGCGSAGQYIDLFKDWMGGYIGIDIDISKLDEGYKKFSKLSGKRKYVEFIPIDISKRWEKDEQQRFFSPDGNNVWDKFYGKLFDKHISLTHTSPKQFEVVLSIFSSHYSNQSRDHWERYVQEIISRTKSRSDLFIMFLDADKIERIGPEQCRIENNATDRTRGTLIIDPSPQGGEHKEPILRRMHIEESLIARGIYYEIDDHYDINRYIAEFMGKISQEQDPAKKLWNKYINCISAIHLRKT
jgi:SAM-dependent methyltransferase